MNLKQLLKANIKQLLYIVAAFVLMVTISIFFAAQIMQKNLSHVFNDIIYTAEANVKTSMTEPVIALISNSFTVREMLTENDAPNEEIKSYLENVSAWLIKDNDRILDSTGIYGYFRGAYIDGIGWTPGADYVPEERPWYTGALEAKGEVVRTRPYIDSYTNELCVTFSQALYYDNGDFLGILAIDVTLERLNGYILNIQREYDGFGILADKDSHIIAHPDETYLNKPLDEVYGGIVAPLENNETVTTKIVTTGGIKYIAFFHKIYNGWYLGAMTPESVYYHDLHSLTIFIISMGAILTLSLSFLQLRLSSAKISSENTLRELEDSLIVTFAEMVESRDSSTGGHVHRTCLYVELLCDLLREKKCFPDVLNDTLINDTVRSAALHDIGKIGISDAILRKPGTLTKEEFAQIQNHTVLGGDLLKDMYQRTPTQTYLENAVLIAIGHHEKYDGSGYPYNLAGEDIPLCARIMALADVYDALVSDRIYRKGMSHETAVNIIKEGSGTHFDPKIAEVFLENHEKFAKIKEETTD